MALPVYTDIGSVVDGALSHTEVSVTAGGGGDGIAAVGEAIDRLPPGGGPHDSCAFLVAAEAVLAQDETLTFSGILVEEAAAPGGPWTALDNTGNPGNVRTEALTLTGDTGGSTERGVLQVNANLQPAERYVRLSFTPDLSAGGVDTAAISAVAAMSGKLSYE
jgi:hypothetical protein